MEIIKSQKIRIYPDKHNQEVFDKYYDYSRSVWNRAIDERKKQYVTYKKIKKYNPEGLSKNEINKKYFPNLNNLRKMEKYDWERNFHNKIRDVQFTRLCQAWDNYFNPNMPNHKKPKYKKKKDRESLKKVGFKEAKFKDKWLILPNAQTKDKNFRFTKIKMSEKLRFDDKIVDDFVMINDNGKWFITVTFKIQLENKIKPLSKNKTAIDLNVKKFDYLKSFDENNNPCFDDFQILDDKLMDYYNQIKYYSRVIAKKRNKNPNYMNSKSYSNVITKLNNAYFKAYNYQDDKINKFIYFIQNNFDTITIEDLDVNKMKMNKNLCKNIHRACFGRFKTKMIDKNKEMDSTLIIADRFYPSTQRCSNCGHIKTGEDKLGLFGDKHGNAHNEYVCYNCDFVSDRDENAVLNLLQYENLKDEN